VNGQSDLRISGLKNGYTLSPKYYFSLVTQLFIYIIKIFIATFTSLTHKCWVNEPSTVQMVVPVTSPELKYSRAMIHTKLYIITNKRCVCEWWIDLKFPLQCCQKFMSSRMLYHADWWIATDVSKCYSTFTCSIKQSINSEPLQTGCHRYQTFKLWHATSMTIHVDNDSLKWNIYMLSSKVKNAHWAEKMTTMHCGIRQTATTQNFVLWLFLNNHDVG
jgi:hypothetical protein